MTTAIVLTGAERRRRWLLGVSLLGNLGLLGFFKYYNFFIASAETLFSQWGLNASTLPIILPIGISFYTFQTLSYTIDVYRRQLTATRSLLDFALFVTFFPQLVAGPIVRARDFLPQLLHRPKWSSAAAYSGCQQILRGYVKKVLIADHLGRFVDGVWGSPEAFSSGTVGLAILAYAGQIYGDFSGYSDIAIGSARLLGFQLPENFHHPYLATSIQDFWRRWHITLSEWLRDYLYISLGGSFGGNRRTYANLLVTMTLGGLWHGAAWTFVFWGIWHGVLLCLHRRLFGRDGLFQSSGRWHSVYGWLATQLCVIIGWTLFRSPTVAQWTCLWSSLFSSEQRLEWIPPQVIVALIVLTGEHLVWLTRYREILLLAPSRWYSPLLFGLVLWALILLAPQDFRPFVYFQF